MFLYQTMLKTRCVIDLLNIKKEEEMKKLFLAGISLLFAVSLAFAQDIDPEAKAREKVATLTEKLALTPDQQGPIHDAILEGLKAKSVVKADETMTEDVKKEQIKSIMNDKHEKVKALLTEEQKAEYERLITEKKKDK